jgi:sigma-B regulation protein RsbU (phosphoserine phosphatase)
MSSENDQCSPASAPQSSPATGESPLHEQVRLDLALAAARMGTWDWEIVPEKLTWDRQMHLLFGLEPDTFGGRDVDFLDLLHPGDRARVASELVEALDRCSQFDGEFRVTWPSDRSQHILRTRAQVTCDADGNPARMIGVTWDVTERRHTEADLERKRSLLDALMEHLPDKIYFKDIESRFIFANKSKLEQHGLHEINEILGKTDLDFFREDRARQAMADELKLMTTGKSIVDKEEKNVWADGHVTWVSSTKMPLRDSEGNIIGTFGLSRDITKRKEAEAELARVAQELRARNAMLEEDLKMARELQSAMLPQRYPSFTAGSGECGGQVRFHHYFTPSMSVSGDFFNVCKISDTQAGIFICDVMGHGVRAALVAAMMHTLLGEAGAQLQDPAALLTHLNRALRDTLKSSFVPMFATAFYVVVDLHAGELRYANAGHPCPLLVAGNSHANTTPSKLNGHKPGPVLGLFDQAQYLSSSHSLAPRDVLLLFTDGLFEVEGPQGEVYDYHQLQRAIGQRSRLPTAELCRGLIDEIQQFSARKEFNDDVCLVAMEVEELVGATNGASAS